MGDLWSYLLRLLGVKNRKGFGEVCEELVEGLEDGTVVLGDR